ncbi:hypothetical protein VF14_35135 [Nostoc linckia z18]|jgi:hypothetical protein|uniref:META domain-containing protein n=2 Tax=Nostoc linckia TaxID=92942 RepID=A0A9Q6EHI4_NOSLI|nr:hypothetical protein [Nostoc linckia]PHK33208.1 hypothetical protein VF12_25670 [Nostoc linckia z15]PHK39231.1 hypothetical protein VF13_34820 [Nostoc linckia z16]PHJ55344.1 hypothetical protein VF02_36030 [Nostoc linckia z1]PHJ56731.1 hypothetical protein VF05_36865 [Nostoc linckia z3]PHJ57739.1 hypothetical protein VF03_36240 [Nostoc linckia z2]
MSKATRFFAASAFGLSLSASLVFYPSTSQAGNNAGVPTELQGEWRYGRISSIQYQDSYTGRPAAPNGSSDQFQLASNGNYQRRRLIQITTYNCSSNLYIEEKGKVKVESGLMTFQPSESVSQGQICNSGRTYSSRNSAKPETYQWSIQTNDYGQQVLVLETTDGQGKAHYGRPQ